MLTAGDDKFMRRPKITFGGSQALLRSRISNRELQKQRATGGYQTDECARGFTLIELIGVLFVAGLISAFVLPSFIGGLRGARLKGETKHLAATLRFARSQAVCSKGLAVVAIDLDKNSYKLTIKKSKGRGQASAQKGLDPFGNSPGGDLNSPLFASPKSSGRSMGLGSLNSPGAMDDGPARMKEGGGGSSLSNILMRERQLPSDVTIASFTYGDETYEDGACNVFFFPRGTSTGALIEVMSDSGASFVIEIEPVTGSVKIKSPEDEY